MATDIVTDELTMEWLRKRPTAGLMNHSDRGNQYVSHAFQSELEKYGPLGNIELILQFFDSLLPRIELTGRYFYAV